MDTFANVSMEMNIGGHLFEEDGLFEDSAERTGESVLDGFLPVTGSDNPFEDEVEKAGQLPVQEAGAKTEEPMELAEENACPEDDAGEKDEPEQKETDSADSNMEKESEDKKRAEHEAAEARRKAEWEAKRQEKQAVRQAQLDRIKAMNEEELTAESMKRISADTEKLTRRKIGRAHV